MAADPIVVFILRFTVCASALAAAVSVLCSAEGSVPDTPLAAAWK